MSPFVLAGLMILLGAVMIVFALIMRSSRRRPVPLVDTALIESVNQHSQPAITPTQSALPLAEPAPVTLPTRQAE